MKIYIKSKGNVKISDSVKEYIESEVKELEKLFNRSEVINVNVLLKEHNKLNTVEITIPLRHLVLRSEQTADTLYIAFDLAIDKLKKQLLRHNKKVSSIIKKRSGISGFFSELVDKDKTTQEDVLENVRKKEIDVATMSVEEAITQMVLLDHDFYIFINEETSRQAIVYARHDGGYGVIDTLEKK